MPFFWLSAFVQFKSRRLVRGIAEFRRSVADFSKTMRRQCQFLWHGNTGALQFLDNGVADELRAVAITSARQSGVQFAQEFFIPLRLAIISDLRAR